jgi:5-methylcytosine-specific restriction endonuclease McrA
MSHNKIGECHLCGLIGKLLFEHVPPKAAFNNRPLVAKEIYQILEKGSFENTKGHIFQKGAGAYTLCEKCNNQTGKWYGGAYADWTYQGMTILHHTNSVPSLSYPFRIIPLRILRSHLKLISQ